MSNQETVDIRRIGAWLAIRIAWQLMRGYRSAFLLAIAAMLVATILTFMVPLISSGTLDYALRNDADGSFMARQLASWVEQSWLQGNLWLAALLIVLLTAMAGVANFYKGKLAAVASDGIARDLKDRLYDHLQHLPLSYHDRMETGDLVQRCTSDVETLRLAISNQVVQVSHSLLLMGIALPLMFLLDPRMALASFVLIIPLIGFGYFYFQKVRHLFLQYDEAEGRVTAVVQENLTGLRVVRAFQRQAYEVEKFRGPNEDYRNLGIRLIHLMAIYWSISDWVALAQIAIVLGLGIQYIAAGTLTIGTLFAFQVFLNLILWPVRQMGRTLTDLGKSVVAIGRIDEILGAERETRHPQLSVGRVQGHIVARDLSFAHVGGPVALQSISFAISPGETVAILGPSGAGKSTLIHLLLRLYDYSSGSLQLDSHELRDLDPHWCRSQFAVVLQEPFLFSKTIADNVRLGRPAAGEADVEHVTRMAHLHEAITQFPQGYKTLVGERGVTLSGGQRQRVALARALLREAPILLLDDALSAVDTETEEIILTALRQRHGKMTTMVIAHRLSTLAHADRVMVLDQGRIIETGTHAQLCQKDGLYRRLWSIQQDPDSPPALVPPRDLDVTAEGSDAR